MSFIEYIMYGSNKCVISFITIIFFSSITYMHRTEWCNIKVTPLQHVNNCQNQEFIYYVAIATVNEKIIKTRTMDIYKYYLKQNINYTCFFEGNRQGNTRGNIIVAKTNLHNSDDFFTYLPKRHDYKNAYISETTWSWKIIFSGNLIQYIYIPKMDLSQNTQKSHLAPFSQSQSHIYSLS